VHKLPQSLFFRPDETPLQLAWPSVFSSHYCHSASTLPLVEQMQAPSVA
jgi:hypothetical protein